MAQIGLEVGLFMNLLVSRKKLLGNTGDFLWSYGGYLIVSTLCDLCGVALSTENTRYFVSDCIESLHDTLKANLSVDGANYILVLNDELISEFVKFIEHYNILYLYDNGNEFVEITGGWNNDLYVGSDYDIVPAIKNKEYMSVSLNQERASCTMQTKKRIDFRKFNFLTVDLSLPYPATNKNGYNTWQSLALYNASINGGGMNGNIIEHLFNPSNLVCERAIKNFNVSNINNDNVYPAMICTNWGPFEQKVEFNVYSMHLKVFEDSYIKTLEEYKAKYENKPTKIVLDSSKVNVKTKWKKESTDIYIPDGDIENLPNGVSLSYALYLFKEGNQCTSITGGWKDYYLSGAQFTDTCILLSQSETHNMFAGTVNEIDFSKYTRMYLDMESTNYCYLLNKTALSAETTLVSAYTKGNRKIVSFSLEDKKISTIIYCAIFNPGTAKIYNIWLE